MILVTAAAGNQGRILIPRLHASGFKIRAVRASHGRDAELLDLGAHEVLTGDASDRSFLRHALDGVDVVYHIGPSAHPLEREMGFAMVDVAMEKGVRHLIFNSVLHAVATKLIQHRYKRQIEEHIVESRLNYTILQPADYMLPGMILPAFKTGVFHLAWSLDRRQAMIDLPDLAEVVVTVAQEGERHYGATYELAASGNHTAFDIAEALAKATGKAVTPVQMSAEEYFDAFFGDVGDKAPFRHQLSVLRAISLWYSQYDFTGNPNVLTWLLGREPTTLEQFILREYAAHRSSRQD